jgi:hypothetical protein
VLHDADAVHVSCSIGQLSFYEETW